MTADRVSGWVFLGAGLFACYAAIDMSLGSLQSPGPGLYPLALGVMLAVLAGILLWGRALWPGSRGRGAVPAARSPREKTVAAALVTLLAYTALLPTLGFGASTFLVLGVLLRLGRMRWPALVVLSLAFTGVTIAAASLVSIPLPAGILFPRS